MYTSYDYTEISYIYYENGDLFEITENEIEFVMNADIKAIYGEYIILSDHTLLQRKNGKFEPIFSNVLNIVTIRARINIHDFLKWMIEEPHILYILDIYGQVWMNDKILFSNVQQIYKALDRLILYQDNKLICNGVSREYNNVKKVFEFQNKIYIWFEDCLVCCKSLTDEHEILIDADIVNIFNSGFLIVITKTQIYEYSDLISDFSNLLSKFKDIWVQQNKFTKAIDKTSSILANKSHRIINHNDPTIRFAKANRRNLKIQHIDDDILGSYELIEEEDPNLIIEPLNDVYHMFDKESHYPIMIQDKYVKILGNGYKLPFDYKAIPYYPKYIQKQIRLYLYALKPLPKFLKIEVLKYIL